MFWNLVPNRIVLVLLLWAGVAVTGESQCTPTEISLPHSSVMTTSADRLYHPGDILYSGCSGRKGQGWCPNPKDVTPRVQLNLPHLISVTSLVLQNLMANCSHPDHHPDFSHTSFLETFDLHYVVPGNQEGTLIPYATSMQGLSMTESEYEVRLEAPLVTSTLQIIPRTSNIYPCFRFKLMGCDATYLCSEGLCLNGGSCGGHNYCVCPTGYFGSRCSKTLADVKQQDYSFDAITNSELHTPAGTFNVMGNVRLIGGHRRFLLQQQTSRVHACHIAASPHQLSYLQYSHQAAHSGSLYMSALSTRRTGFTTSIHVKLGHNHRGNVFFYTSGGHLPNHRGVSLSYRNHHLIFDVSTGHHIWHVSHRMIMRANTWYAVVTSWHPHTGAQLVVNQVQVGWTVQPSHTCLSCTGHSLPLTLGVNSVNSVNGNATVSVAYNVNIDVYLRQLLMYGIGRLALINLGIHGPYMPAPPGPAPTVKTTHTVPPTHSTSSPKTSTTLTTAVPRTTQTTNSALTTVVPKTTTTSSSVTTTAVPVTTTTSPVTAGHRVTATSPPLTTRPRVTATSPQYVTTPATSPRTGTICYDYASEASVGVNRHVARCHIGEVCTLFRDKTGFTAKCLDKQLCETARRLAGTNCWKCCDQNLCNDQCSVTPTPACQDKPTCALLLATGYDVCSNKQLAFDTCQKTCHVC